MTEQKTLAATDVTNLSGELPTDGLQRQHESPDRIPQDRRPAPGSAGDHLPAAPLQHLRARAALLRRLRAFFDQRGFMEVQTPTLSADTMVDRHLEPYRVVLFEDPRHVETGPIGYLQTSPEFHMKRLLAAGAEAIYQVAPAYRAAEHGPLHNREFTIVEWYRVGDDMDAGIQLLDQLTMHLLGCPPAERLTYADAFGRHAQIDPLTADLRQLQEAAGRDGPAPDTQDRDALLQWIMMTQVEPRLARDRPTVMTHFPASQAALARLAPDDPRVAERFELYYRGVELANGYHELCDAEVLVERLQRAAQQRRTDGKAELPIDNRLVAAMRQGLPPCTGVAMGWDRVVMLAVGVDSIHHVVTFPSDRA